VSFERVGWDRRDHDTLKLSLTLDRKDEFASAVTPDRLPAVGGCIFGFSWFETFAFSSLTTVSLGDASGTALFDGSELAAVAGISVSAWS